MILILSSHIDTCVINYNLSTVMLKEHDAFLLQLFKVGCVEVLAEGLLELSAVRGQVGQLVTARNVEQVIK